MTTPIAFSKPWVISQKIIFKKRLVKINHFGQKSGKFLKYKIDIFGIKEFHCILKFLPL